jgi:hypothetical protein
MQNCKADFHRYVWLYWNGSSRNALLRDFSESPEEVESLLPKVLSDMQNCTHCLIRCQCKSAMCCTLLAAIVFGVGQLDKHTMAQPSTNQLNPLVPVVVGLQTEDTVPEPETVQRCGGTLQAAIKAVAGIHVLLTHSLFGGGTPRRFLLRVSLAKPTSAPLRF